MVVRTTCTKCGVTIKLDFGELTKDEALDAAKNWTVHPANVLGATWKLAGLEGSGE